jgi:hypothetical protein
MTVMGRKRAWKRKRGIERRRRDGCERRGKPEHQGVKKSLESELTIQPYTPLPRTLFRPGL